MPAPSRTLRECINKHNRKTAEKNLRYRDWKGASSILIEYRRHPFFSSTRKKY
jgi:hypothetical protein